MKIYSDKLLKDVKRVFKNNPVVQTCLTMPSEIEGYKLVDLLGRYSDEGMSYERLLEVLDNNSPEKAVRILRKEGKQIKAECELYEQAEAAYQGFMDHYREH